MQVRYKQFNQQPSFAEICGPARKRKTVKKTFAQKKVLGPKAVKQKTLVISKAKQLLSRMKPYTAEVFAELIKVVKVNPNMSLEDISSIVFKNLKAKDSSKHYSGSVVSTVYLMALKEGAITTKLLSKK